MPNKSRKLSWLILLALLISLSVAWAKRYDLLDWWRLRNYVPPARIVQLANDTTMTDEGRKLFYVNHPELNDELAFNQNCTISEQSIVLGCYISGQGIYLFDVTDERLTGVQQVTAAHEMLHAAYERLSGSERKRIDTLTQQFFEQLQDVRIQDTVTSYRNRDPSVVPNELHSILATEVVELPAELEAYYSRYFTDRKAVVAFSKAYEAAFQERKDKVAVYDKQLAVLKQEIESDELNLAGLGEDIKLERQRLDALLAAKRFEEYNAGVPPFNAKVDHYNNLVNQIRTLIDRFNRLVAERNSVALEENELIKAIDSRPDTIPNE